MLPKKNRLTKKEFAQVFQKGRTFALGNFVVKYLPYQRRYARFAFSVGLKISKKATERNLLRRKLYQCVDERLSPQFHAQAGDYIIILKPHETHGTSSQLFSFSCPLLLEAIRKAAP